MGRRARRKALVMDFFLRFINRQIELSSLIMPQIRNSCSIKFARALPFHIIKFHVSQEP